jgi:predicted transposase YbfD/YdcC
MQDAKDMSCIEESHFIECFYDLQDPRTPAQTRYPMQEILFLTVCSVVSGYEQNRAIEEFGKLKIDWLRRYFPYEYGIPTHETIGNVIGLIDKVTFEKAFVDWVKLQFGIDSITSIHIDGKRLRGSADKLLQDKPYKEGGKNAEIIVNAYASDTHITVAQASVAKSGDEKEGARRLIEELNIKNKVITGDGNFCTKDFLKLIRKKKGHYLMTLKRNNPTLFDLAERYFGDVRVDKMNFHTAEKGHGRTELRTYHAIQIAGLKDDKFNEYKDLCKIIRVRRQRKIVRKNKSSDEVHYYITSSNKPVQELALAIRSHWSVENNLHWVLDMEFNEDASRKRNGNQASNFSLIRKIALNMINHGRGKKSIKAMRMACSLSDNTRQNILGFP